jgi:uncharacterized protein YjbI with pentapeptide repeats
MHSKDPEKRRGVLYSQFLLEFKAILAAAGTGTAEFTRFVFPHLSIRSQEIEPHCVFTYAYFVAEAYLHDVTFKRSLDFSGASFLQPLSCRSAIFDDKVDLQFVEFNESADFTGAKFSDDASLSGSKFLKGAYFKDAVFQKEADLSAIGFHGIPNFSGAQFLKSISLANSTFELTPVFLRTVFADTADFSHVGFIQGATFPQAKFLDEVSFEGAIFGGEAHFLFTQFAKTVDFSAAQFLGAASFRETHFRSGNALQPGPVFSLTRFSPDASNLFYKTDLSHALFHNCDITNITFASVVWRKRAHNNSPMVFEENLPLDSEYASTLTLPGGSRDYGMIAQLYHQLKKNYDDHLDYWAADHFHYGEMETQRLAVPTSGPLLKLRAFYHRHLSLIAWYRRGSSYGNSYLRPAAWLFGTLLFFALLFPVNGLRQTTSNPSVPAPAITYRSVWPAGSPLHDKIWAELKLIGKSCLTAIDTATFQKSFEYTPTYPYGRGLAILESLLTATLFALFLLAIRRQFRR